MVQAIEVTRPESMECSAIDWFVVVSYTRRRCLSIARETKAKSSPFGENEERVNWDGESSTVSCATAEVDAGRLFGGLAFGFFDFCEEDMAVYDLVCGSPRCSV